MKEVIKISNVKQSNAVVADRLDHIITLLAQGKKRAQILVDPLIVSWRMANSSIDKYLQKAKGEIVENSQQARSEHLGRAVMNLDYLYTITLNKLQDDQGRLLDDRIPAVRVCLDIQKEKNRLLQLSRVYDPLGPKDIPEDLMPDAVRKMLDDVKIVNTPTPREIDLDAEFGKGLIAGSSE